MTNLAINGNRKSGEEVRAENTTAVTAIANIVRNSLGPAGLDKMIVDEVGEIHTTNDGATILDLIKIDHPAAQVLVDLAKLQDKEIGDGTTSVVLIAAELVRRGHELVKNSIHPTTVIAGFQQARKEACKFIAENLTYRLDALGEDALVRAAATAMSSKLIGGGRNKAHFARLAVDAMNCIGRPEKGRKGNRKLYDLKAIKNLMARGDSMAESKLIPGVVLVSNRTLSSYGMPTSLKSPKILLIDFDMKKRKLEQASVVSTDPDELEAIRASETNVVERRMKVLLDSGANLILSGQGIDDFALHAAAKAGVVAVKNLPRIDLRSLAKATGAKIITNLAALDSKNCADRVDSDAFGTALELYEERLGDIAHLLVVRTKPETTKAVTILMRGPNEVALEEMDRAMHDVLCSLKRVMESSRVVVGGGVVESALSIYLENFAETIGSREQLAIAEFASALLAIPKALTANGAFDSVDLVAQLRAAHNAVLQEGKGDLKNAGLNLRTGRLRDNLKAGVFEPAMGKIKAIKFATEAAVTILRIDDCIATKPANVPAQQNQRQQMMPGAMM